MKTVLYLDKYVDCVPTINTNEQAHPLKAKIYAMPSEAYMEATAGCTNHTFEIPLQYWNGPKFRVILLNKKSVPKQHHNS